MNYRYLLVALLLCPYAYAAKKASGKTADETKTSENIIMHAAQEFRDLLDTGRRTFLQNRSILNNIEQLQQQLLDMNEETESNLSDQSVKGIQIVVNRLTELDLIIAQLNELLSLSQLNTTAAEETTVALAAVQYQLNQIVENEMVLESKIDALLYQLQ